MGFVELESELEISELCCGLDSHTAVMLVPVYLTFTLPQKQLPRGILLVWMMDGEDW
jgi:hypothetical protein